MSEILSGASYLRNPTFLDAHGQAVLISICEHSDCGSLRISERVWELLETPQTVATICRVLASERAVDPDACRPDVQSLLEELYQEDLIQMSPDS